MFESESSNHTQLRGFSYKQITSKCNNIFFYVCLIQLQGKEEVK